MSNIYEIITFSLLSHFSVIGKQTRSNVGTM